jgi:phage terminase large subunit-like protein
VSSKLTISDEACSSSAYCFDEREADRAVFFLQEFCRHVRGPLANERFLLQPWQRQLVRELFGWKRPDGLRRYRFVWLELPRKAGKSTFAAAIGLYMLMVDPEPSAEIVIAAANAEQASVCFNIARDMINGDPDLAAVCKTFRRGLVYKDAVLSVVSSRQEAIHGRNISCLLFDDVSLQPTRELHDALITSTASRLQPLTIYATTAGTGRTSLAWQLHDYAVRVRDGLVDDPSWLVLTFGASVKDDWADPKVWRKAHPGIGVSIAEEFIQQEFRRAEQTPGFIASFRRLYLNVWGEQRVRWLDMERWDRSGSKPIDPVALIGRECVAGLDLSTTTDLSALVLVFADDDSGYTVLPYAFCPAETIEQRHRRDRVDYPTWRATGCLIATEGNTIDHAVIRAKILELARLYRIREIAYDRWNSSMLISQLVADGIVCVPMAQTSGAMNAPARELERVVAEGRLRHGGNPILRWCASNAVAQADASGDIRPSKSRSSERIDVLVALLMGISRHLVAGWPGSAGARPAARGQRS